MFSLRFDVFRTFGFRARIDRKWLAILPRSAILRRKFWSGEQEYQTNRRNAAMLYWSK
jgi:hypothetical protein